ncbi:MAG TPA: translation initiation factor IF-3 [Armatimonadota bacterium]
MNLNERIRAREVRLIGEEGDQLGIMPTRDALELARDRGLDLVEVAPNAAPPVCRIIDYGRFKYEQNKRDRDAQKKSKVVEMKGIRLRPRIDDHDFNFRLRNAIQFLKEGDKVKITVIFRSREITHPEFARDLLNRMAAETTEIANVEKPASLEGRTMTMILTPK